MKSIDDALELRGRIFGAFELAENLASKGEDVDHLLTFVVVGAGPTGVEMAGQIAELSKLTLKRDFRSINSRHARRSRHKFLAICKSSRSNCRPTLEFGLGGTTGLPLSMRPASACTTTARRSTRRRPI
jgi:hypothetical protein